MFTALEMFENEAGRWEWVIISMEDSAMRGKLGVSAISFKDKADAEIDGKQHLEAEIGADGRPMRSKEDLRHMIKLIASDCADCDDSYFGGIYWHERDELGCNWSVSTISGGDWSGCLDCVQPAATRLRQTYNIADEG
jgi:hypothetical protein